MWWWIFARPRAEAIKWLGLFCMLADHAWRFLGVPVPAVEVVGRAAFPAFAVAMAVQAVGARADLVARRVVLWGLLVMPAYAAVSGGWWLDVLLTLGLGLQAWVYLGWVGWRRCLGVALCAVGAAFAEYGVPGFVFVLACCAAVSLDGRPGEPVLWAWVWCAAVVVLTVANGVGFLLGVLCAAVMTVRAPLVPRTRVFLAAYVVQWPLMFVLRWAGT